MSIILPSSLTPHVTVLSSPDLLELIASASLPPLHHILQSYSPLPQVTTRTTSLTPIHHVSFGLRFSDLQDIEVACKEDPETRASRTIDWIGGRISKKASKWVEDIENRGGLKDGRSVWWDELRRCVEGDATPSRDEGWNHPVAIILAVSTLAPNPLAAIIALHNRTIDLPPWIDPSILRYTLIVHPSTSPLSNDESIALLNAVKKQYGLHSHLLNLILDPDASPLPILPLAPRLPPPSSFPGSPERGRIALPEIPDVNELKLSEKDTQNAGRFVREFVTMSLVPWMERCVLDWNENFSSTRRLPSRLFSSTRKLFGSSAPPSPSPVPGFVPTPISPIVTGFGPTVPSQQRRLAEFATFLGDYKLAVTVWESLRKEGKGGSDILPLLLAPSPSHISLAASTLAPLLTPEPSAHAQLRALLHAVRWEAGVQDLVALAGDQWLVWAAGIAEEPPTALLLAQAGQVSRKRGALRRAAMWYVFAANRLEKCGVKPLTMYFLRKAHELYVFKIPKNLSPSFFDAEGPEPGIQGVKSFDRIVPTLEHSLGRLKYTTGDTEGAVRLFLGLLRGSRDVSRNEVVNSDQVFLDDFRMAFEHMKSISGDKPIPEDLSLPINFSFPKETRLRKDPVGEGWDERDDARWQILESSWRMLWKANGTEPIDHGGDARAEENIWVDVVMKNPMDTDISLGDVTVEATLDTDDQKDVEIEIIDEVVLSAKETRIIPICVRPLRAGTLKVTHLTYSFLSLLPVKESLASRGKRLHATAEQRQSVAYGPDILPTIKVREVGYGLEPVFPMARGPIILALGESVRATILLKNIGSQPINEIWMVGGEEAAIWLDLDVQKPEACLSNQTTSMPRQIVRSNNSLASPAPLYIPLDQFHATSVLRPMESVPIHLVLHGYRLGPQAVSLLFVFRHNSGPFCTVRALRHLEVMPILEVTGSVRPSISSDGGFMLKLEAENVSPASEVSITQVTAMSPCWTCSSLSVSSLEQLQDIPTRQLGKVFIGMDRWADGAGMRDTTDFVTKQLGDLLHGQGLSQSSPPVIDLLFSHVRGDGEFVSVDTPYMQHMIHSVRRGMQKHLAITQFPHIPDSAHPFLFPLFNEHTVDLVVFWEIKSEDRSGHLMVSGLSLGAGHGALREMLEALENVKFKRTMFAETERARLALLESVRTSEWNVEMDPIVVRVHGETIEHNFSTGPCLVPVRFSLQNYSATHPARFVLHLEPDNARPATSQLLPPKYSGLHTHRGSLKPGSKVDVQADLWVTKPGMYNLGGWLLETEVGEPCEDWKPRTRFSQAGDEELSVSVFAFKGIRRG